MRCTISRPAFLLLEAIIACSMMAIIASSCAGYYYHMHLCSLHTAANTKLIFDVCSFFEEEGYISQLGKKAISDNAQISWCNLPESIKDRCSMQPIKINYSYRIGGKEYMFSFVSVIP